MTRCYTRAMRFRVFGLLALALTASAVASAAFARTDPPYDDDRALRELASHEYRFESETDVVVPDVHCALREVTSERAHIRGAISIVLGRRHLGVEGRDVMALSADPTAELALRSSGTLILPLVAELEFQTRVTNAAAGSATAPQHGHRDMYADGSMPFSALRSVLATLDVVVGLVVRDDTTGHLRRLELTPYRGVSCSGEFLAHVVLRDGKHTMIDGTDVEPELVRGTSARAQWDVVLHVFGDPSIAELASSAAALDHACAGDLADDEPSVLLDLRTADAMRDDLRFMNGTCHHGPAVTVPPP